MYGLYHGDSTAQGGFLTSMPPVNNMKVYFDAVTKVVAGLEMVHLDGSSTYIPESKYEDGKFEPTGKYFVKSGDNFGSKQAQVVGLIAEKSS